MSCAKVALGESRSININRNPIGVVEFQGGVKLSLLISLSNAVFICWDKSVQKESGCSTGLAYIWKADRQPPKCR